MKDYIINKILPKDKIRSSNPILECRGDAFRYGYNEGLEDCRFKIPQVIDYVTLELIEKIRLSVWPYYFSELERLRAKEFILYLLSNNQK